jgi:hypothetical protein
MKIKKETLALRLLFLFALLFFVLQRAMLFTWDFSVYVLNAKYLFGEGNFFEWAVPPLTPFLLGLLSLFGWKAAEYLYIAFVVWLHFFSSLKLAEKFGINSIAFYALSLSPFLLFYGLINGTELLSLSLLQLFLAYMHTLAAPAFLGLCFLTRYNYIIFLPLLLIIFFDKKEKRKKLLLFLADVLIFFAIISPWFLYNYLTTGNALTSLADSYALNIKFREKEAEPFNATDILKVGSYLLPFAAVGIILALKEKRKKKKLETAIMLLIIFLTLFQYTKIPLKDARYLFSLLLPFSFFSTITFEKIKEKKKNVFVPLLACCIAISFGIATFALIQARAPEHKVSTYSNILNELKPLYDGCALASNAWPLVNYLGIVSEKTPRKEIFDYKIEQGYRILFFKFIDEPDYINKEFMESHKNLVMAESQSYILFGNSSLCAKPKTVNQTYLQSIAEMMKIKYNQTFSISLYKLIFGKEFP